MKRYIRSNKYIFDSEDQILLDDKIFIDIEVKIPQSVFSSNSESDEFLVFPGVDQFKEDVLHILEDEYHFEVIQDNYDGVVQKGYITDREDSISIYFDTYFDLKESQAALDRLGVKSTSAPESGKIYCFIHLRFSDHDLNNYSRYDHRAFLRDNATKYTSQNSKVTHVVKEEDITIPEHFVYRYYKKAISVLKNTLDARILSWVQNADFYKLD